MKPIVYLSVSGLPLARSPTTFSTQHRQAHADYFFIEKNKSIAVKRIILLLLRKDRERESEKNPNQKLSTAPFIHIRIYIRFDN